MAGAVLAWFSGGFMRDEEISKEQRSVLYQLEDARLVRVERWEGKREGKLRREYRWFIRSDVFAPRVARKVYA